MQVPSPTAFERHERRQVAASVLALGILAALIVPAAPFAGKSGGTGVTPWIGLDTVAGARAGAGVQPSLGDYVTFATVVPKNVNNPRIEVLCYQGDRLVFGMAGALDYAFLLGGGGSIWLYENNGLGAECDANLYYFSWKANTPTSTQLATTHFSAGG